MRSQEPQKNAKEYILHKVQHIAHWKSSECILYVVCFLQILTPQTLTRAESVGEPGLGSLKIHEDPLLTIRPFSSTFSSIAEGLATVGMFLSPEVLKPTDKPSTKFKCCPRALWTVLGIGC